MPELQLAQGGQQMPYVESIPGIVGANTPAALTANAAYFFRVRVAAPLTVTKISFMVGTASGNVDAGIYASTDGGVTLTRLVSAGSTAAAGSSAIQSLTIATTTLVPGVDYWLAFAVDNATATIGKTTVQNAISNRFARGNAKTSSFPLPSSVASLTANGNALWLEAS
jgi:hypothetical protein